MVPVDSSVKLTWSGAVPLVGKALNAALEATVVKGKSLP